MEQNKIKELLELVRSINKDEFKNEVTSENSYDDLLKEIQFLKSKIQNDHQKSEKILEHITQIASGDLSQTIDVLGDDSIIDAISMGINVFTEELRDSTISVDEYKDTLNALPYVIWASNTDFSKVLYVNDSISQIFGVSSSEMLANKNLWVDLIHPEDRAYVETKFDEFFESGHFEVKYRLIKPTGEEVWILDQAKFLFDNEGKKYRIVGICKDITLQERNNKKIKESSQKLLHAHRVANMGHWELNVNEMSAIWTEGMYDIFEIDSNIEGEELFKLINQCIHPEFIDKVNGFIKQAISSNQKVDFIYEILTLKTKSIKVLHSFAEPILDLNGKVVSLSGITQDISEKSFRENKIKETNKRLEDAQKISKIGSWEWDLITHDLVWSKQHYVIFEIPYDTPKDVLYQEYRGKIHPDDLAELDPIIEASVKSGEGFEYVHRAIMDDGRIKYVKGIGNLIKNKKGEIVSFQGTAQDITVEYKKQALDDFIVDISRSILYQGKESDFYNKILAGVLNLLDSEYGFIGEVFSDELTNSPFLRTYALTNISWNEETKKFYDDNVQKGLEFRNLNTLFGYALKHKEIVISNDPLNDPRKGGLPHGHPPLNAFLGIPIFSGAELVGMIGVANKKGGYDENDISHILPFTSLFGSIIQSNKIERNKLALELENNKIRSEIQNFFNMSSDFMAIVSPDGYFERVNQTFNSKLGYEDGELIGKHVTTIIHPEDLPEVAKDFEEVSRNRDITFIENDLRYISKNNQIFWVNFKIVIDHVQNKHYVSGRDITQQRIQDLKLKEALHSVQEYKYALDQIAIVSTSDLQGNILTANDKFIEISGYSLEELVGHNHNVVNSGYHDKAVFEDLWKTISSGKIWRGEICNKKKNGENYWVDSLIVPFLDENHKPLWYFSIRYDITEKKAQENLVSLNIELQKEKEIAEQKTRLKERFLANMSHEIRTPMNSILGLSNLMEKVGTLNPKQMDYIKTIKLNSKNLLNIINDILDLSKIEEGKLELENATIDVRELVVNTVKTLTLTAHKKKIDLFSEIDVQIPHTVLGDSTRLNQVILNLTNNAIKFTDKGSVTIKVISLNKTVNDIAIRFEIVDTGIGIESSKVEKIFEPFTQEKSSTTRLYGGTGLGLTISNQIIQAFGSEIKVKSEVGVGSVFYFDIVFNYKDDTIKQDLETPEQEYVDLPILKGVYSILLVEDNPFNQMVAEDTLKDWYGEFKIDIAENGLIALDYLRENKYDLVLMDIQMPELDGHQTTVKARKELNIETPIIAMTAQATPAEIQACMISGMNDYISKPFDENKLFATITKWLHKTN
jgi:PAS domain S-box-containing protein